MLPAEVQALLTELLARQQAVLGADLLGVYLRGSLVTGDFDPQSSDVDLLCITCDPLTAAQFEQLKNMHAQLGELKNPYARDLELAYLTRLAAWAWRPGEQHPTLGRGEELEFKEHGANWLLERYMVLNQGQVLYGLPPTELIAPVSAGAIRWAVKERLLDWGTFARIPDDPAWQAGPGHAAYCIETMYRALHTLYTGSLASKPAAVAWATLNLPSPWAELAARVAAWKESTVSSVDSQANRQAQAFILWAAQQAGNSPAHTGES